MIAPTNLELALVTAAELGFKHGFDYDHIAAISDITSVEADRRRAMRIVRIHRDLPASSLRTLRPLR